MTERLSYEELWLIAFVKTHLAEVTVGFVILWSAHLRGLKRLATEGSESLERSEDSARAPSIRPHRSGVALLLVTLFTASTITHPPLWFVLPQLMRDLGYTSYLAYVITGELLVTLTEAIWYWSILRNSPQLNFKLGWWRALLLSLTLNVASVIVGLITQ